MTSVYLQCDGCKENLDRYDRGEGSRDGTFGKLGGGAARDYAIKKNWFCYPEADVDLCPVCKKRSAVISYTNHRGELGTRTIFPIKVWFGSTEWHKKPQYFLKALDMGKGEIRDFAMTGIHSWG